MEKSSVKTIRDIRVPLDAKDSDLCVAVWPDGSAAHLAKCPVGYWLEKLKNTKDTKVASNNDYVHVDVDGVDYWFCESTAKTKEKQKLIHCYTASGDKKKNARLNLRK